MPADGLAPGALVERHLSAVWRAALAVAGEPELAEEAAGAALAAAVAEGGRTAGDALVADAAARAVAVLRRERRRGRTGAAPPYAALADGADADALRAVAELDDLPRAAVGLSLLAGLGPAAVAAALRTPERAVAVQVRAALDVIRARLDDRAVAGDPLESRLRRAGAALAPPAPSAAARILAVAVSAAGHASVGDARALAALPIGLDAPSAAVRPQRRRLPPALRRAGVALAGAALLAGAVAAIVKRPASPHARPRPAAATVVRTPPAAGPVRLDVVAPIAPSAVRLAVHGARPAEALAARDVTALLGGGAPVRSATFSGPADARTVVLAPRLRTPFAAVLAAAATAEIVNRLEERGEHAATLGGSGAVADAALLTRHRLPAAQVTLLARRMAGRARALGLPIRAVTAYPLGVVRVEAQPSEAQWFGESRRGWLASMLGGDGAPVVVDFELRAPDGTAMAQAVLGPDAAALCACAGDGPVPDSSSPPNAAGPTRLHIDVVTRALVGATRRVTLDCDAGRATGLADAASACARIAGDRYRLLAPDALGADVCPGAFGTPRVRIGGTYAGIVVERSYGSCAGHEADLWRAALAPVPPHVPVPAVAGRSLREAVRRLRAAGLEPRLGAIPALAPGPACADLLAVSAQEPPPRSIARRGSRVAVHVARAPRRCPPEGPTAVYGRVDVQVPDVRGLGLDAALERIVQSGLRAALEAAPAGLERVVVGAQAPAAASALPAGGIVTLRLAG
jgi:DNA-directed RNA polymerase specialized sigma24 family protein